MTTLQEWFYEKLIRKFNNQSVFQVCLWGRNEIRLKSEDDEAYLNREIENAISYGWCDLHKDYREPFINGTAITVEQCIFRTDDEGWTCSFILRIKEPFHGLYIYKCLEHAGEYRGIGEEDYYHYGKFRIQSMEPIDGNGNF